MGEEELLLTPTLTLFQLSKKVRLRLKVFEVGIDLGLGHLPLVHDQGLAPNHEVSHPTHHLPTRTPTARVQSAGDGKDQVSNIHFSWFSRLKMYY